MIIYAKNGDNWVALGNLTGINDTYVNTEFILGSQFFNDIKTGLEMKVDIDSTNRSYFVTIGSSTLDVEATVVPLPTAFLLLGAGLSRLALYRRSHMKGKN